MSMNEEATVADSADELYHNPDSLNEILTKGFSDLEFTNGRYNFHMNTLGWSNIDAFYRPMKGTSIVDLFINTDFESKDQLEVHVFLPAKKLLTVGVLHTNDGLFHFEKYKGQIPMFLNDHAIAFACGSIGEKIYYGIQEFAVGTRQTIQLQIKETTEEELMKAFEKMNINGIDLDVITKKRIITARPCGGPEVNADSTSK
jgi:hypothetical protein